MLHSPKILPPDPEAPIRAITVRAVSVPLRRPVIADIGRFDEWPLVLVDIETEAASGNAYVAPYRGRSVPALVAMILSPKLQRIGDLAAGTVVISERFGQLPREPVIFSRIRPLERGEINHWKPDSRTLAAIDDYLSRRHVLSHERGHELCADLAVTLARKLEFKGDPYQLRDYPMSFLARAYVTFAGRDENEDNEWLPRQSSADKLTELEVVPRRTPRQHRTRR